MAHKSKQNCQSDNQYTSSEMGTDYKDVTSESVQSRYNTRRSFSQKTKSNALQTIKAENDSIPEEISIKSTRRSVEISKKKNMKSKFMKRAVKKKKNVVSSSESENMNETESLYSESSTDDDDSDFSYKERRNAGASKDKRQSLAKNIKRNIKKKITSKSTSNNNIDNGEKSPILQPSKSFTYVIKQGDLSLSESSLSDDDCLQKSLRNTDLKSVHQTSPALLSRVCCDIPHGISCKKINEFSHNSTQEGSDSVEYQGSNASLDITETDVKETKNFNSSENNNKILNENISKISCSLIANADILENGNTCFESFSKCHSTKASASIGELVHGKGALKRDETNPNQELLRECKPCFVAMYKNNMCYAQSHHIAIFPSSCNKSESSQHTAKDGLEQEHITGKAKELTQNRRRKGRPRKNEVVKAVSKVRTRSMKNKIEEEDIAKPYVDVNFNDQGTKLSNEVRAGGIKTGTANEKVCDIDDIVNDFVEEVGLNSLPESSAKRKSNFTAMDKKNGCGIQNYPTKITSTPIIESGSLDDESFEDKEVKYNNLSLQNNIMGRKSLKSRRADIVQVDGNENILCKSKSLAKIKAKSVDKRNESVGFNRKSVKRELQHTPVKEDSVNLSPKPKRRKTKNNPQAKIYNHQKMEQLEKKEGFSSNDSGESDLEEVEDLDDSLENYHPDIPKEGVTITLRPPKVKRNRKSFKQLCDKPQNDGQGELQENVPAGGIITFNWSGKRKRPRKKSIFHKLNKARVKVNRRRKEIQITVHQVHLLCLISRALHVHKAVLIDDVIASAFSLIPTEFHEIKIANIGVSTIREIMTWFNETISVDTGECKQIFSNASAEQLCRAFEERHSSNTEEFNLMFLAVFRSLGIKSRMCFSLHPVSFKDVELLRKRKKWIFNDGYRTRMRILKAKKKLAARGWKQGEESSFPSISGTAKISFDSENVSKDLRMTGSSFDTRLEQIHQEKKKIAPRKFIDNKKGNFGNVITASSRNNCKQANSGRKKVTNQKPVSGIVQKKSKGITKSSKNSNISSPRRKSLRKCASKSYKLSSGESDFDDDEIDKDYRVNEKEMESDEEDSMESNEEEEDVDSIFDGNERISDEEIMKENTKEEKHLPDVCIETAGEQCFDLHTFSENSKSKKRNKKPSRKGVDQWIEVYSSVEKRWISVQCFNKIIDKPYNIEKAATDPISYVIAVDSSSCVKDVTKKYSCDWLTNGRKLQTDAEWWEETLKPFKPVDVIIDKQEDDQVYALLRDKPMPTILRQFIDHPLYALKSKIKLFEALYPADVPPIGYFKGEPIYPRECIYKLRARTTWCKLARVIRAGEKPYKILKAPKWDRSSSSFAPNYSYEFYGIWQTDPFVPLTASNGKIPRNEYGNVEVYKPCMLPRGTVHLKLPGLNRIANKLGIDCCNAVVGFGGYTTKCHAKYDGYVVCKENVDILKKAWLEEQKIIKERRMEKRKKIIYNNWKKLIRGVLVREKLRMKYGVSLKS